MVDFIVVTVCLIPPQPLHTFFILQSKYSYLSTYNALFSIYTHHSSHTMLHNTTAITLFSTILITSIMQYSIAFLPAITQFSNYRILSVTGNHISIGVVSNKLLLSYLPTAHQNTTLTSVSELAFYQSYHTVCYKIAMHFSIFYSDANDLTAHDCKINLSSLDRITLLVNIRQHYFYCFLLFL